MRNDNKNTFILIAFIAVILTSIMFIYNYVKHPKYTEEIEKFDFVKKDKYLPNEVIPVYVDDEQMAKIYLKDYVNYLINDIEGSYDLLEEEYRDKKFGNVYNYKLFIDDLKVSYNPKVRKYATYKKYDYKYYDLYDNKGNRFIFKTNGVMQYKVFFDDYNGGEK